MCACKIANMVCIVLLISSYINHKLNTTHEHCGTKSESESDIGFFVPKNRNIGHQQLCSNRPNTNIYVAVKGHRDDMFTAEVQSLVGAKPNTNPKTNPNPNTSLTSVLILTLTLTLFTNPNHTSSSAMAERPREA